MKLKDIQYKFHEALDAIYGKEEVNSFFFILIESFYNVSRLKLAMKPDFKIKDHTLILNALAALVKEKPIQYILGETEFYGLPFKVNNHVLIPRPETEELVDWIINIVTSRTNEKSLNILDIGTGSGCIAISLAKKFPNAKVYALDVSKDALMVAEENAELNNVEVEFIEDNILKPKTEDRRQKYDIIVSNPPYIRAKEKQLMKANVLNNEPHLALFVKNENPLLFYESISEYAAGKLRDNGMLFFEINEYLGNDMIQLLKRRQFKNIELKQDIFNKDRMLKGEIINNE